MDKREICEELSKHSDDYLNTSINVHPIEQPAMTALFTEMVRVTDVLAVTADSTSKDDPKVIQYLNIARLGLKLAASLLYSQMEQPGFPMAGSNQGAQKSAAGIFPSDHRYGFPIKSFLRTLDREKKLSKIPYILAVRKFKNTNWYFSPSTNMN